MASTGDKKSIKDNIAGFITGRWQILTGTIIGIIGLIVIIAVVTFINAGKENEAVLKAEKIQDLYSDYSAAEDDQKTKLRQEIEQIYDELTGKFPRTYGAQRAIFVMANIYFDEKEWDKSAQDFSIIGEKFPDSYLAPVCLMNAAAAYEENGKNEQALEMYKKVMKDYKNAPLAPKAYFSAARLTETADSKDEAIAIYQDILKEYPTSNWTKFARTRIIQLENEN